MTTEFKLPELGENIEYGTVAKILVAVGDALKIDQAIVELETDKAVIEVPSAVSGVIAEIFVKEGEKVKVGQKVLAVSSDAVPAAPVKEKTESKVVETAEPPKMFVEKEKTKSYEEKTAVEMAAPARQMTIEAGEVAPAAPSVRRFAREIGIAINKVRGSGPGGRISIEDVKSFAKSLHEQPASAMPGLVGVPGEPLPDFSKWGEIERKAMSQVRQKTASHLSYAWTTIPHVTQFDKADITGMEELRKRFAGNAEAAGGKLTMTAILLKVISAALKVFPQFNASVDMARNEIVYKKYVHIGIAVDTDRGLLVPVVRDADQKNILQLSAELSQLSEKARNKKLALEEMQGGCFTISNLGGIGGTAFAPVVNSPEVAILGVSRAQVEPVFLEEKFMPRLMLPLSLSYDHRLIDGADGARFLRWVVEALEQPFLLALEG
jgi:pyruvate dehydrogenase E2 component (dihydrolipoamide acetyltransferase)